MINHYPQHFNNTYSRLCYQSYYNHNQQKSTRKKHHEHPSPWSPFLEDSLLPDLRRLTEQRLLQQDADLQGRAECHAFARRGTRRTLGDLRLGGCRELRRGEVLENQRQG